MLQSEMLELCTTPYLLFTNFLCEHFLMYNCIFGITLYECSEFPNAPQILSWGAIDLEP